MKARFAAGHWARLGFDEEGLAAVTVVQELDGPAEVEWQFGAVALRLRHKGGGYADELCRETFDELTVRAIEAGLNAVKITALVYEENRPSQAMCRRHGFVHVSNTASPGVQVWHRLLPV
jgi:RimJ/RimL family protein N-acetyltransferase